MVRVENIGLRNKVAADEGILVMTARGERRQIACVNAEGLTLVFPTFSDLDSEQDVTMFECPDSARYLLKDHNESTVGEVVVTREVAGKLKDLLCS